MNLKDARELLGISQFELDREAGLTKGAVNDIEQGRNARPAYDTVVRIVRALRRRGLAGAEAEAIFPIADDGETKVAR
jgi:transcriptional regulator with XRE-family HTH domain